VVADTCGGRAAAGVDLLVGLTVGAWLGSLMALVTALVAGWRLRFRPSASTSPWRRQAASR
jgi:gas vesicle protein